MIKVTFEFASVELAIATLGKIMVGAPVAQKVAPESNDKAPPVAPAAPTTRKPRADAGKKRGSYKNVEAQAAPAEGDKPQPSGVVPPVASTPETAAPDTPAPSTGSVESGSKTTAPDAAVPSEAEAQAALEAVFTSKGLPAAQQLLATAGLTRLRDLAPENRADFIKAAKGAAA